MTQELDVRPIPKPQRHPLIFARFDALGVGESFVLVNSHDPKHLRQEFDRDHQGAYDWQYLDSDGLDTDGLDSDGLGAAGPRRLWRIRITRRTDADPPRLLGDVHALAVADDADTGGAVWRLEVARRQLDANVIRLRPHARIDSHTGPDLDVLLHVVQGAGVLTTASGTVDLADGALAWLPRRSERAIVAGPDGLCYLSVHTRRPALSVGPASH
ncbi:MAG: DUF2249 domain-containing protein [Actinomycetota bacterium]|nr:DUF2249 domain-containing protein [Actinomycetota bacterium]